LLGVWFWAVGAATEELCGGDRLFWGGGNQVAAAAIRERCQGRAALIPY
jgi:hypothetical protein